MRKIYSALLATAIVASANGAELKRSVVTDAPLAKSETLSLSSAPKMSAKAAARATTATPNAVPEGEWTNLGKATWFEDLLTIFSDIESGLKWEADIYESATTPGYYRIAPYTAEDSPVVELLGKTDETAIFYIDATDPDKVFVDGDVIIYNLRVFSQMVKENEWGDDADAYGTLADGVISFPAKSFAYSADYNSWGYATKNGEFKIALPGAEVKDYSFKTSAPLCDTDNTIIFTIKAGADVNTVKAFITTGNYSANADNLDIVASSGQDITGNSAIRYQDGPAGFYTALFAALDAEGNVVGGSANHFFMLDDDNDNWEDYGTATFSEPLYSSLFSDIDAEEITAPVQKHATEDRFRIVEPYANHSVLSTYDPTAHNHGHYIHINATDPDKVLIEASPVTGTVLIGFGQGYIWSRAAATTNAIYVEQYAGKKEGDVVTFPANSLYFGLSDYESGSPLGIQHDPVAITLTKSSAISSVIADSPAAAAEYYNLQGVRISNPKAGQLLIKRQGDKAEKIVF